MQMSNQRITLKQFYEFTSRNEGHFEFIDGDIYAMASPNSIHQEISRFMTVALSDYFSGKSCKVFVAPYDVLLSDSSQKDTIVVQPDLIAVCDKDKIKHSRCEGSPDLVIEIVSESSRKHDQVRKLDLYMRYGVKEYWIINPIDKNVVVWRFENGDICSSEAYNLDSVVISRLFKGLDVDFHNLDISWLENN